MRLLPADTPRTDSWSPPSRPAHFLRPGGGPISISLVRDPVKDSQLSYAGLRDPAGNSLGNAGQIWGGVIANQGNVQFSRGDAQSGFYVSAGGQYLTGYHVETNSRIDGNGGAYWRLLTSPEYGNLSIGVNFFAMHYANNENAFTHGMGGYFSPQGYFLANVPFTFAGHYLTKWHYNIVGGLGVQAFQENKTPLWPLAADKSLETSQNNPMLPGRDQRGRQLRPARPGCLPDQPPLVCRRFLRRQQHPRLLVRLRRLLCPVHVPRAAFHGYRSHRPVPNGRLPAVHRAVERSGQLTAFKSGFYPAGSLSNP